MSQLKCFLLAGLILFADAGNCLFGQMVYVPSPYDATVAAYVVNAEAGILTEVLPRVTTPGGPMIVVTDPRGKFAYVAATGDLRNFPNIYMFSINQSTGALVRMAGSLGIPNPTAATMDPAGKFLYVAAENSTISAFSVNASTGALTVVPSSPFPTRVGPTGVVVEASGKFLYATSLGGNNISAFSINATSGALTQISGSPFPAGSGPSWIATDAAGKFIFVANKGSNNVSVYAIDSGTGALTPAPGSPFAAGTGPTAVAADPAGHFLYVSNGNSDNISGYFIDSGTGALTPMPVSPFSSPRTPFTMAMDPSGKYLYVANLLANNVSSFAIGPESGALSAVAGSPFASGSSPQRLGVAQLATPIQPPLVVKSVLNAASYAIPGLPGYGIARGSRFVVFGQNLGPAVLQLASTYPLPNELGGTSIKVSVGGSTFNAIMVYSYVTQVSAIMPSAVPAGDGVLTVTYNGRTSMTLPVHVVNGSVGIFTRNQAGTGPAIVQNYNSATDQPVNSVIESAHPGQTMILWGTGLGAVTFDETRPPAQFSNVRTDAEVWVGNKRANVSYSGRSQYPGVDQINFTLPADVPLGCYVPIAVRLGSPSVVSNFASISVTAQGKVCSDAHGLSAKDWAPLTTGGALNIGWLQLLRINLSASVPGLGSGTGLVDTGWGGFFRWDAITGAADLGLDMFSGRTVSLSGCSVYSFHLGGSGYIPIRAGFLDAGSALRVAGTRSSGQEVQTRYGYYEAHQALGALAPPGTSDKPLPIPMLDSGTINVDNGSGGSAVRGFRASLNIPASPVPLDWTNFADIAASGIDRSKDLTFTWTGGDATSEYVAIAGAVFVPDMMSKDLQVAAAFVCTEKADVGKFTVPSVVLSALPASTPGDVMSGMMMAGRAPLLSDNLKFTASGLDIGYLTLAVFNGTLVAFQ